MLILNNVKKTQEQFKAAASAPLSVRQTLALLSLSMYAPRSTNSIAREIGVSAGAMTGIIDKLERLRYAKRYRSYSDRRSVLITLTDKGKALASSIVNPTTS